MATSHSLCDYCSHLESESYPSAMNTDRLPASVRYILRKRRQWRYRSMMGAVKTWPGMSILDIGCGIDGRSFSDSADSEWNITGIDLWPAPKVSHKHPRFRYEQCDAQDMSRFPDLSFDLVVSVGMLEHVTDPIAYANVCSEFQRVGRQLLLAVPFKWAWIEPHYGFPFFGALPHSIQRALVLRLNLGSARRKVTIDRDFIRKETLWRSNAEYRASFPGSKIKLLPMLDLIAIVRT